MDPFTLFNTCYQSWFCKKYFVILNKKALSSLRSLALCFRVIYTKPDVNHLLWAPGMHQH